MYRPLGSVTAVCTTPRSTSVNVTVTPGITAPELSVIWPATWATFICWAKRDQDAKTTSTTTANARTFLNKVDFNIFDLLCGSDRVSVRISLWTSTPISIDHEKGLRNIDPGLLRFYKNRF